MKNQARINQAIRLYSVVVGLYPKYFEQHFRSEMIQTFKDHYADELVTQGNVCIGFWLSVITDVSHLFQYNRYTFSTKNL